MDKEKLAENIFAQAKVFKKGANESLADQKRHDLIGRGEKKAMREANIVLGWSLAKIGSEFDRDPRSVRQAIENYKQGQKLKPPTEADTEPHKDDYGSIKQLAESGAPPVEKRAYPLIEEAQKEHMLEIRDLIEEWRDCLHTPAIEEAVPGYHHPISDVQNNHLFEHLKEHLPSPILWLNYTIWSARISSYLFSCEQLIDDIRRDNRLWDTGYRTDSGELAWVNTEHYAFGEPILKRISNTALENRKIEHETRFEDFLADDDQGESKIIGEVGEGTKTCVMYVDSTPVGRCVDNKVATETYKAASDYHLKEAEYVVIFFRELKSLQDKIHQEVEEVLAYQDYRWYNCQFCRNYHFPELDKQRWPQWAADNMYSTLVEEHFKSLIPTSKELMSRLKILVSFREKWIDKGVPIIEGNIVDGCWLINPMTKKSWPMGRSDFPNPLDNSRQLDIRKPMDSLQAQCLLEHFNEQFPNLADYNYWRMLNFTDLQPTLIRKMCSWLENEEFRHYGCYVCSLLKEKFSP